MLSIIRGKKGQSVMEYVLLFTIVVGAFTVMQFYVRRSLNARIKEGSDNVPGMVMTQSGIANGTLFGSQGDQYEPYYMAGQGATSSFTSTTASGTETGATSATGGRKVITGATRSRTGNQTLIGHGSAD